MAVPAPSLALPGLPHVPGVPTDPTLPTVPLPLPAEAPTIGLVVGVVCGGGEALPPGGNPGGRLHKAAVAGDEGELAEEEEGGQEEPWSWGAVAGGEGELGQQEEPQS